MRFVALYFVVSLDYEDFVYSLIVQTVHAIHLNDVYLNVPKVNGFAWDSRSVQYSSNASNYFEIKHFA